MIENFCNYHTVTLHLQERFEASHKMIRKYRAGRSRRHDKKSKIDILHWLMLDSDPRIRRYRKEKKSKKSAPATATNEDELLVQSMFEWIVCNYDLLFMLINCFSWFIIKLSIFVATLMKCNQLTIFFHFRFMILWENSKSSIKFWDFSCPLRLYVKSIFMVFDIGKF